MTAFRHRLSPPPSRQQGMAAVFAAIAMVAFLAVMGFAIDIGRLYYGQRDLQRLANIAALDSVRVASGCSTNGMPASLATVVAEVTASLNRNLPASERNSVTPQVVVGRRALDADGLRSFTLTNDTDMKRNAVRVTLTRQSSSRLFPLISGAGTSMLSAVSVAEQSANGAFTIGSRLVGVDPNTINNVAAGLFCLAGDTACQAGVTGLNIGLSALDASSGIASVGVSSAQLATALGLSVEDLSDPVALSAATPVLGDVISGLASSLSGTASSSVVSLLQQLGGLASENQPLPIADLLGTVGQVAPDAPLINLYDLLMALGQAAKANENGLTAVQLPTTIGVPGVLSGHVFLKVLEPPKIGKGPAGSEDATAHTAQTRLEVRLETGATVNNAVSPLVNAVNLALGLFGGSATSSLPLKIGIDLDAAVATARLDTLQCPAGGINDGMPIARLSMDSSVAAVRIGSFSGNASSAPPLTPASSVPLLSINSPVTNLALAVSLNASLGGGAGSAPLDPVTEFERRPADEDGQPDYYRADGAPGSGTTAAANPQTRSSNGSLNLAVGVTQTGSPPPSGLIYATLNAVINSLISGVTNLVNTTLSSAVSTIATPLLANLAPLGVTVGGGTVTMQSVTVAQPELITVAPSAASSSP